MNSEYVLLSRWQVDRSRESLWDVLEALLETPDPLPWWPSVQVTAYDGDNLDVRAASGLGYAVTFRLANLEAQRPSLLSFTSEGDLRGRGVVTFVELTDGISAMDIDWRVATDRRWMRWTSWLLRPVFIAGHHIVMRQGEKHLNAWLAAQDG
ncbi:hypothetical protein [Aeromicrobium ginsengisoli]|uniref:Polyketide cyclase n=1 Tax=Aeromicrobium ginsengisoli TaxID=363867 RepID=A0A5M4FGY2_9ACTN|nr:hypothetical protein [Aeromicrobium ginsengisoli]KAA1399377.1 hypothetical protein ESP70_000980 [Aeromicrobium ginsengisoli]